MRILRRHFFLLTLCTLGCAPSRPPSPTVQPKPVRPDWVSNVPQSDLYLYAVGWGIARLGAEENARAEIAQYVRSEVSSVFRDRVTEVDTEEQTYFQEVTEHQIEVVCRQLPLSGIEVVAFHEKGSAEHACLVRVPRDALKHVLEEQQERYAKIILGFVTEGKKAESKGQLGTALKQYFMAYSVLPRLPYALSVPSEEYELQEAHGFLYGRILALLSEVEWTCAYVRNPTNPLQSMVALTLHGSESDRVYDALALEVTGKAGREEKDTDGDGQFGLYATRWREGTDIQLKIRVLSRSFPPYEELTTSEQEVFGQLTVRFLDRVLEVVCRVDQDLRVFVQIAEMVDGKSVQVGDLERNLRRYLSGRQTFQVVDHPEDAELKLTGRLESRFSSTVDVLGHCYKSTGEVALRFGENVAQTRVFAWTDEEATKAFDDDRGKAGRESLQEVSKLLFEDVRRFFEEKYSGK